LSDHADTSSCARRNPEAQPTDDAQKEAIQKKAIQISKIAALYC
jgi:hypothetical protein